MHGTNCKEAALVYPVRYLRCSSYVCVLSLSVVSDSLQPHGLWPARLCPWDSPGKYTGVGCHTLLQGIFPTQGLNLSSYVSCIGRRVLYHWLTWEDRTDLFSCFWILFFRISFCGFLNFFLTDSFPHLSWLFRTWVPSAKLLFIVSGLVSYEVEAEVWSLKKMLRRTGLWLSEAKHSTFILQ